MLSLAEEVLLLALDDDRGAIHEDAARSVEQALVAATLAELALDGRLHADRQHLTVVSSLPTGDPIQDDVLARLVAARGDRSPYDDIRDLLDEAPEIKRRVLGRLVDRGILREEKGRVLWVFGTRRYPLVDDREVAEVKTRLRLLLAGPERIERRDAVLVALVEACRMWRHVLTAEEYPRLRGRIEEIAGHDVIGQGLAQSLREIEVSLAFVRPF